MPRTLLALVQQVCAELGLNVPTYVVSNPDAQVSQILSLCTAEGEECAAYETEQGAWPALRKTYNFTLSNGVASYSLPADYSFMLPSTMWDATTRWRIVGPVDPAGWNMLQYGAATTAAPFYRFKIEAGQLSIFPTPSSSGDVVAFTYASNGWCKSAANVVQTTWLADTDTYILDERLFILGVKMRFKQAKGLDYVAELSLYQSRLNWAKGNAGGSKPLTMGSVNTNPLLSWYNLPDAGYGV